MRPILGGYFAGEVVSLGKSVKNFKVGDRVFHSKFGMGIITDLNENKANVDFDKAGIKNVITDFLYKK